MSLSSDEKKVLAAFGKDFEKFLLSQASLITRTIVEIANKSGYDTGYLQYLFYVLFERSQDWPSLPKKSFGALKTLPKILTAAGEIPHYRDGLQTPDLDNEQKMDDILKKLAVWAQTKFTSQILRGYLALLKKHLRAWLNASPDTSEDKGISVLKYIFEDSLLRLPIYTYSDLMDSVMRFIL